MSLADELLADFEEDERHAAEYESIHDEIKDEKLDIKDQGMTSRFFGSKLGSSFLTYNFIFSEMKADSIREIAKMWHSSRLQNIMQQIDKFSQMHRDSSHIIGPVESDPEYRLIVEANNCAAELDNEIGMQRLTPKKCTKDSSFTFLKFFRHNPSFCQAEVFQALSRT